MKRNNCYVLIAVLMMIFMISGCAEFSEKFIPKKKKKAVLTRKYFVVKQYNVHPNLELYTKRYVFWKNWHKELLSVLTADNHKKTKMAVEQEMSNLYDMWSMLDDEKGNELMVYIDKLAKIETAIKKEKITKGNDVRIRRTLETLGRQIKKHFSYTKMRGFFRDDFRSQEES